LWELPGESLIVFAPVARRKSHEKKPG